MQHFNNHVTFLQSAADKIPNENRTHHLLKSYYLSRCDKIVSSIINKKSNTNEENCLGCCTKWKDQQFSMKINSIKNRNLKAKKLVELKDSSPSTLIISRSKQISIKKYRKQINPISEIKCLVCGTKKKVIIRHSVNEKKKRDLINEKTVVADNDLIELTTRNTDKLVEKEIKNNKFDIVAIDIKREKRKKDKFAGLKIQQTTAKIPPPTINKPVVLSTIAPEIKKIPQIKNPQLKAKTKKNKNNKKLSQQNKKNQKIISETKQRNNILLLANMLKKDDKKLSQNSLTTGLQNMLRK